jgi:hypothetical protein
MTANVPRDAANVPREPNVREGAQLAALPSALECSDVAASL